MDLEKLFHVAPSKLGHGPTHYDHIAFLSPNKGHASSQTKNLTMGSMLFILMELHMIT